MPLHLAEYEYEFCLVESPHLAREGMKLHAVQPGHAYVGNDQVDIDLCKHFAPFVTVLLSARMSGHYSFS